MSENRFDSIVAGDATPKKQNPSMDAVRSILFQNERDRIVELEREVAELKRILAALQNDKADEAALLPTIQQKLVELTQAATKNQGPQMAEALGPVMSNAMRVQIRKDHDDMAEVISTIIGEATRLQVTNSPNEIRDALAPIMLSSISQAVSDQIRELQQQIDARLTSPENPNVVQKIWMRFTGVDPKEVMFRRSLPFEIRELFLIQNQSGLLISHFSATDQSSDSDLISAMLTAIRDFVGDAFQGSSSSELELREIQYGDQQIIIKSGEAIYCAVVVHGILPEGFRAYLQRFVSELHLNHRNQFLNYTGDSSTLPDFHPQLNEFVEGISAENGKTAEEKKRKGSPSLTKKQVMPWAMGCSIIALVMICLLTLFAYRLLPVAIYGIPTSPPVIVTVVATPTPIPTPSSISVPIPTPSLYQSKTPLLVRNRPNGELLFTIPVGITLTALREDTEWVLIVYTSPTGEEKRGWVLEELLEIAQPKMTVTEIIDDR